MYIFIILMSTLDLLYKLYPIFSAILGLIVTGIVFYYKDKNITDKKISDLEKQLAVLNGDVMNNIELTKSLNKSNDNIKTELGLLSGDIREIKTGIKFILERLHNE